MFAIGALAGTVASFFEVAAASLLLLKPMVEYKASKKDPCTMCDSRAAATTTFVVNRMIVAVVVVVVWC